MKWNKTEKFDTFIEAENKAKTLSADFETKIKRCGTQKRKFCVKFREIKNV